MDALCGFIVWIHYGHINDHSTFKLNSLTKQGPRQAIIQQLADRLRMALLKV